MLEGFAFLTGRLREKVEDEFPELTHSIINMLWPNYLRPVPSLSIVQFSPDEKAISHAQKIKKGVQLDTNPVAGTACHYRTCREVELYPLKRGAVTTHHTRDSSTIDVSLSASGEVVISDTGVKDLRFFIGGETYSAEMLYLWLGHYLKNIQIVSGDTVITLPRNAYSPAGFGERDALLPYPKNVYEGYRYCRNIFRFPLHSCFLISVHLVNIFRVTQVEI